MPIVRALRIRRLAPWLLALVLAGCALRRNVATPDFARMPVAPFARAAAVAIALREWRLFGERYDDRSRCPTTHEPAASSNEPLGSSNEPLGSSNEPEGANEAGDGTPERQEGLWQRVGEYRWYGLDPGHPNRSWTGKHDERGRIYPPDEDGHYAWSAAFISYVMRMAGAGDRFPYDDVHATYINQAARAARGEEPVRALVAMRPDLHAPARGDLICAGREGAAGLRFDDLPAGRFASHCVLVVDVVPEAVLVVGGNVADAVTLTRIPTTTDGMLVRPDGTAVDPCAAWCVVLAVQYEH